MKRSRTIACLVVAAAALMTGLGVAGSAHALVLDYCGPNRGLIAPNSWCFQGNAHYWDYNRADGYSDGRHMWPVCEAIKGYYSRTNLSRQCGIGSAAGTIVNCGSPVEAGVANDDPGFYNYVYGHAESYPNAGC